MFKQYKLKNGLRVIHSPLHETEAVTVLILFKVGSRYERRNINGISHFVEHLMFKGTKKRPTTLDISKELDGIGASYNAFTSKDHTGYYIKASHDKIELLLDMLSDMLFNSKFDPTEIERERKVIIEEINMYEDNPMMMAEDFFEQAVYEGSTLGWQIAGPKEVIRKVTRNDIVQYFNRFYGLRNMIVGIAGNTSKNIIQRVQHYFNQPDPNKRYPAFPPAHVRQTKPRVRVKFKETEQVHLMCGYPSYSYYDKRLYPLMLLSIILGGNMSSRLFISIRERKGLCYYIRAGVNIYEDTGNFAVQAGLDRKRIHEAIRAIHGELVQAARQGVTPDELQKAKDFLKGKLILDFEDSEQIASYYTRQALLKKRVLSLDEYFRRIDAVGRVGVQTVARDIMRKNRLNLTLIGPYKQAKEFETLLHSL